MPDAPKPTDGEKARTRVPMPPSLRKPVTLDLPSSGDSPPATFCANGEATVNTVSVELWHPGATEAEQSYTIEVDGGTWQQTVELPEGCEGGAGHTLFAYPENGLKSDGEFATLNIDTTKATETCEAELRLATTAGTATNTSIVFHHQHIAPDSEEGIRCEVVFAEARLIDPLTGERRVISFATRFTTKPNLRSSIELPNIGPGRYIVRFVLIDGFGTIDSRTKLKIVT